jgi:hypothetical protein
MHADFPNKTKKKSLYNCAVCMSEKKKNKTHGTGLLEDAQNHPKTIWTRTEVHLASSLLCPQQVW